MSDFNTVPAVPKPEKPEGEPEMEQKKKDFEVEDWGAEPPDPEPDFFRTDDDVTRISPREQPEIPPVPAAEEINMEPPSIQDAQSVETAAFEQLKPDEFEKIEKVDPGLAPDFVPEEKPAEPFFRIPGEPPPAEPEVIDTPAYIPPAQGATPVAGEPPKKNRVWLIVLIVVAVLCLCCILAAILIATMFPTDTFNWDDWTQLRSILPV